MIGNSYGQVLHAHLLNPVSAEMTSRLEHEGQNRVAIPVPIEEDGDQGQSQNQSGSPVTDAVATDGHSGRKPRNDKGLHRNAV